MDKPFHLDLILKNLLSRINNSIERLEASINQSSEGQIEVRRRDGKLLFYKYVKGKTDKYLGADKTQEIKQLIQKKFDTELLRVSIREKKVLERAIKDLGPKTREQVWEEFPQQFKEYLKVDESINAGYIEKWKSEWPLTKKDEEHKFLTSKGDYVRSKSEYIIAERLFRAGIPYHYETNLTFCHGFYRYWPDFKVLNPKTLKVYYWEHFGMMDDKTYFSETQEKLEVYCEFGYLPGKNLILSFETATRPLNVEYVDRLIAFYLT